MGEMYLVTGGRHLVIYGDGLQTGEFTHVSSVAEPERPDNVKYSCADISRARDLLGYEPRLSFVEGVARRVAAVADRRAGLPTSKARK